MNLKKLIFSFLIAVLTVGCFTACEKPEIEAAITDGGDVIAWCLAYDVRELVGTEPFQADQIPGSMPVYNNKYKADGAGVPLQPAARDLMLRTGKDIVQALDEKILDEGFYDTTDRHLNIRCEQIGIQIDPDETVFIEFRDKYPLPMKLGDQNQDYQEALDYAIDELEPLLKYWQIENPRREIKHDYTFSGEKHFNCFLTDEKNYRGSLEVNFLEGYLSSVRWKPDLLTDEEILGEYPTVSLGEAKTLLLKGQYYSIVPLKDPIEESDISGVVIGYKEQCYDEVFLPFYAFYVDITDREEAATPEETLKLGLKDYTTYLVPAIESEYLDEFPEIIVHFN